MPLSGAGVDPALLRVLGLLVPVPLVLKVVLVCLVRVAVLVLESQEAGFGFGVSVKVHRSNTIVSIGNDGKSLVDEAGGGHRITATSSLVRHL